MALKTYIWQRVEAFKQKLTSQIDNIIGGTGGGGGGGGGVVLS